MNIVLFEPSEAAAPLSRKDARAQHILSVLRRRVGEDFDAGIIDGPRGKAVVKYIGADFLDLEFEWAPDHPAPVGPRLAIGFPRPQTSRDILRDATSLGVAELNFISTARSDPNYAHSSLWSSGEWRRHVTKGAAQAFDTHLPHINWQESLIELLDRWAAFGIEAHALDLYDTTGPFNDGVSLPGLSKIGILIGPERGWAEADRKLLNDRGVARYDLGPRAQRTEIAVAISLGIIHAAAAQA